MLCNVGGIDRILRILVGLGIIGAGIYFQSWWGAVGLVALLTGATAICPLYYPLNVSTYSAKKE